MAIQQPNKGRNNRPRSKKSFCHEFRHIITSDLTVVGQQPTLVHNKDNFQPRAVLFINHHAAKGVHEVHRPDRSTVGSHVQKVIRHDKRMKAKFKLRPAILREIRSGYHVGRVRFGGSFNMQNRRAQQIKETNCTVSNPEAAFRRFSVNECPLNEDSLNSTEEKRALARLPSLSLDQSGLATDFGDKGSLEGSLENIPGSSVARTVLYYYDVHFVARILPVEALRVEHVRWAAQSIFMEDGFMFAILALGASISDTLSAPSFDRSKSERPRVLTSTHHTITLTIKAIVWLHTTINSGHPSPWMTIAYGVACLILIETIDENIHAIRQHSNALQHLISSPKSTVNAAPTHVMHVLMSTYYLSCIIGGDCPLYPPILRHLQDALCVDIGKPKLTHSPAKQAFVNPNIQSVLGQDLAQNLQDIRAFTAWREYHIPKKIQSLPVDSELFHLIYWRAQYLTLCHPFRNHTTHPHCLQEPVRIAMLIFWTVDSQIHLPGSIVYRNLATQLLSALPEPISSPQLWREFHDLLLWALLLGAFITDGQSKNHWFVMNIVHGLKYSGGIVPTWEQVEEVVGRFLFVDRVFERGFKTTWNRVVWLVGNTA